MSDMVERIAKAIADHTYAFVGKHGPTEPEYDCGEWEDFGERAQEVYRLAARAAYAAMMETDDDRR